MTKISMNWADLTLTSSGHAGAAPKGMDIVCAAISILTESLVMALLDDEKRGRVKVDWQMNEQDGSLRVHAEPKSGQEPKIRAYFKMAMVGLKAMQEEYPGNIKIGEVRVHGNL